MEPPSQRHEGYPAAAVIEIVEHQKGEPSDHPMDHTIVPNDVRINGQSLLVPSGYPVIVHDIINEAQSLVKVTLTLVARRVTIAKEYDEAEALRQAKRNEEYREKLASRGLIPDTEPAEAS